MAMIWTTLACTCAWLKLSALPCVTTMVGTSTLWGIHFYMDMCWNHENKNKRTPFPSCFRLVRALSIRLWNGNNCTITNVSLTVWENGSVPLTVGVANGSAFYQGRWWVLCLIHLLFNKTHARTWKKSSRMRAAVYFNIRFNHKLNLNR